MIINTLIKQCRLDFDQLTTAENWKKIKWMNQKAPPQQAYCPTAIEHLANVVTHGFWIIPSVLAALELLQRSDTGAKALAAVVYGATLIFLFGISTSFHCSCYCSNKLSVTRGYTRLTDILHRCDRAMIYVFIAGSYFPWLTLEELPKNGWASEMYWFVWFLAVLGIVYQQTFHEKYKMLETVFYLIMGIMPALLILQEHQVSGIFELQLGGALYVVGVMFFKSDGVIPCAHAIWHSFVVMAAAVHYYAILKYLYPQ